MGDSAKRRVGGMEPGYEEAATSVFPTNCDFTNTLKKEDFLRTFLRNQVRCANRIIPPNSQQKPNIIYLPSPSFPKKGKFYCQCNRKHIILESPSKWVVLHFACNKDLANGAQSVF